VFDHLPPETLALKTLLADLHDDLEDRVTRLRQLMALEYDFGSNRGLLLPGGSPAYTAYSETRQAFVQGYFLSVILLSQYVLENALASHISIEALSAEIHGHSPTTISQRPSFRETIKACRLSGLIDDSDERDLVRLAKLRNALTHFRTVDDPSHLDRRAIQEHRAAGALCEDDARFAIGVFIRILAKPDFRFAQDQSS
jgi:hypothetical protein